MNHHRVIWTRQETSHAVERSWNAAQNVITASAGTKDYKQPQSSSKTSKDNSRSCLKWKLEEEERLVH